MTFDETLSLLDRWGEPKMRLHLAPSQHFLEKIGRPDRSIRSIIVAGTNGKGSVTAYLTSILKEAGYRVGTYTSPHIETVRERIALDGKPISEKRFTQEATSLWEKLSQGEDLDITYFEFLTLLAAETFAHANVDIAIFEVGLGGRLDTTNALERIGVVITSIDYDHQGILGSTLTEIAREKGAVMRPHLPAVIGHQPDEALEALRSQGEEIGAKMIWAGQEVPFPLGIRGSHQSENAASTVAMILALREMSFKVSNDAIEKGLRSTRLIGRLECWKNDRNQKVWLDIAHNVEAMEGLADFFKRDPTLETIVGILNDKNWEAMLPHLISISKSLILSRPHSARTWNPNIVMNNFRFDLPVSIIDDPAMALREKLSSAQRILVTGSTYTVGAVRPLLTQLGFQIS